MKKIVSLLLAVCMCLSLAFTLTGCFGGSKNAWQEYLGLGARVTNSGIQLETKEGTVGAFNDGYSLTGILNIEGAGEGSLSATMKDRRSHREAVDGISGTSDDMKYLDYRVVYNKKTNVLYVEVDTYQYYTQSYERTPGNIDWMDGFGFMSGVCLTLKFDMAGYFENGEVTTGDVTENSDFDMECLGRNYNGVIATAPVYTERNTNWKSQAMDAIIASINETLDLIDNYIKDNPA